METTRSARPDGDLPAQAYEPPTFTYVGQVHEIVQHGGGKLSRNAPDGPDVRKPPGR